MKRVLIRPPWHPWLENRMFSHAEGCAYVRAFSLWRQVAAEHGFQLDTWDMLPWSQADCVWMMDLPPHRGIYEQARRAARQGVPFVLHTVESPVLAPQSYVAANQKHFDFIVTLERDCAQKPGYFSYHLPNTVRLPRDGLPFARRRCAVMLNTNRVVGYFAMRQPGLAGLPGLGQLLSGWRIPMGNVLAPARGELYSWRRNLARAADVLGNEILQVFGAGWKGGQISWLPGYSNRPYGCSADLPRDATGTENHEAKLELVGRYRFGIAVENYQGHLGYISEKVFDVMMAGAVPVYLGEERITDFLPCECFVDARDFRSHRDLLRYLRDCPESGWQAMREAGQKFLHSEKVQLFTDEAFAERMVSLLPHVFL